MRTQFSQSCPACGRRMLIAIRLRGETVSCGHCNAKSVAHECPRKSDRSLLLLGRADQLLAASAYIKSKDSCAVYEIQSQAMVQNHAIDLSEAV